MDSQKAVGNLDTDSLSQSMKMHVYNVWSNRLQDDQIFDDSNSSNKGDNVADGEDGNIINEDNLVEFIEALDVQNIVTTEELQDIIDKNSDKEEDKDLSYTIMKEKLYDLIVEQKKVPFKDLINQHFSLPVDRVSRFLDMLNDEYTTGESNQLK